MKYLLIILLASTICSAKAQVVSYKIPGYAVHNGCGDEKRKGDRIYFRVTQFVDVSEYFGEWKMETDVMFTVMRLKAGKWVKVGDEMLDQWSNRAGNVKNGDLYKVKIEERDKMVSYAKALVGTSLCIDY